jgi:hypothetical protein
MGWGRMLLLGNVGQQMDIDDLKQYLCDTANALNKNRELDQEQAQDIAALQKENAELKLCLLGLTRMLAAKGVLTEPELKQLVFAMDATNL